VGGINHGKSMDEEGLSGMRWTIRLMNHSDGRKACHELARPKKKTKQFHVTFKQSDLHGVSPVASICAFVTVYYCTRLQVWRLLEESAMWILLRFMLGDSTVCYQVQQCLHFVVQENVDHLFQMTSTYIITSRGQEQYRIVTILYSP